MGVRGVPSPGGINESGEGPPESQPPACHVNLETFFPLQQKKMGKERKREKIKGGKLEVR